MKTHPYRIFPPLPPTGRISLNGWWAIQAQKRRRARAAAGGDIAPPVTPFVSEDYLLRLQASNFGGDPGSSVNLWPDSSANGNDATQETESSQPTFQEVTFAGKTFNVMRFDTVDDGMSTPAVISDPTQFSIFVMWRPADPISTTSIVSGGDLDWMMGTYQDRMLCFFTDWSGLTEVGGVNSDDFYLLEVRITPGETPSGIYLNGVQTMFSPGGGSEAPNQIMLGASGFNGYPGGCDAAEIIIYDRLVYDEEAAGIRAYFQEQYNYLKI